MKREREEMESSIVWQSPANPPQRHDYIFNNGVRYVRPYYFEFISHAKKRWAGKTIVDLFTDEFKGRSRDYYVSAVESGRIQVEGKTVSPSYIVQSSQKISHFLHRHEPPVMALDVLILQKEPDVLTVYKPASVPIESGVIEKKYIAKVRGVFPEDEKIVNANVDFNAREGISTAEVSKDCGNGITALKGKVACTKFIRISTDGKHSIVSCRPITGRTHQIRVHLQYIGHPIANDTLYLSESVDNVSTEGFRANREFRHFSKSDSDVGSGDASKIGSEKGFTIDPLCTNCPDLAPKGYDGYEEGLWLHCVQYSGPGWVYECPLPDWAILS
ncbi:RNA pseudouridine synthase 7 isoform X4 [Apium graveolens]|uniref:RNA pseudouridine synthase 7 isoform X4 n=1 Tax=Apium graveolens TaxID=4045 RepID=UPI003D79F4A7